MCHTACLCCFRSLENQKYWIIYPCTDFQIAMVWWFQHRAFKPFRMHQTASHPIQSLLPKWCITMCGWRYFKFTWVKVTHYLIQRPQQHINIQIKVHTSRSMQKWKKCTSDNSKASFLFSVTFSARNLSLSMLKAWSWCSRLCMYCNQYGTHYSNQTLRKRLLKLKVKAE